MSPHDAPEQIIYNCHVHTFTIDHVPRSFLPRSLRWMLNREFLGDVAVPLLRLLNRVKRCPQWLRYAGYLNMTASLSQRQVFELLYARYPGSTRFVVLPMDLAFMAGGRHRGGVPEPEELAEDLDTQHRGLLEIRREFGDAVIPFYAVDPRRHDVLDGLRRGVEEQGFRGIKLYPNLGYRPADPRLAPVWAFADEHRLPVMTHCSRGGIHGYDERRRAWVTEQSAEDYGAPACYADVLKAYPNMRLCLAHLGGQREWERFVEDPWYHGGRPNVKQSWLSDILDMLPLYPNLYTDISYTIFYFQEFVPVLKVLLEDPRVLPRVLFGSDYYMADLEADNERLLSLNLRAALGERLFWQIANVNPKDYLRLP